MENRYRLLHIMPDEKVVDSFISLLEKVFPGESMYAIYGNGSSRKISKIESSCVRYFRSNSRAFRAFLRDTSSYKRIIFHFLNNLKVFNIVRHSNMTVVLWGGDLYGLIVRKGYKLYSDEDAVWRIRANNKHLPVFLYKMLVDIRDKIYTSRQLKLLKRCKYVGAQPCDMKLLHDYFPNIEFRSMAGQFSYYPIETIIGNIRLSQWCYGKNIWVNNSAAMSGNHISIFEMLKHIRPNVKIYVPISYGGVAFASYIEQKGEEILGDKFIPLKDYLPLEEYYCNFLMCNSFLFGHYRQCAYGNILVALYFGAKCFFYKCNPLYNELLERGFTVFNLEEDFNAQFAIEALPLPIKEKNRIIVLSTNSYETLLQQLRVAFG